MVTRHRLKLIARYLASECTEQERHEVELWVNSDQKNKRMFDSLQAIWELSGRKSEAGSSKHATTGLRLKLKDAETSRRRYEDDRFKIYRIIPHKRTGNNLSPLTSYTIFYKALIFNGLIFWVGTTVIL